GRLGVTARRTRPRPGRLAGRRPGASTRERLVYAARELLEQGGYAASSVQAVADRAGVAAGAMYRHFPSKAALFIEVFRDAAKRDLAAVDAAASVDGDIARLEAAIAAHARGALRHRRPARGTPPRALPPPVGAAG